MLILLLICLLLIYILQQKVYEKNWKKELDVKATFLDPYVYEGEVSTLKEEVVNDKWLPLSGFEVRLGVSRNLKFQGEAMENSNVSDQSYRRDVFALFSHQKVIRTLSFTCQKRGCYQITRSEIVGSDFFFHREYQDERPQDTRLFVFPRVVDVRKIRRVSQAISGSILRQNRLYPDPFEFSGIREYQKTDPMHHINWKASARNAELMVNQFDSTTSVDLTVLLDTCDYGILKYVQLTEEAIRITASLAAQMQKKNMDLFVRGNGICKIEGKEEKLDLFLKAGTGKLLELNQHLAALDTAASTDLKGLLREEAGREKKEMVYVLIARYMEDMDLSDLLSLMHRGNSVIWVIPYLRGMDVEVPEIKGIQILRWEVEK